MVAEKDGGGVLAFVRNSEGLLMAVVLAMIMWVGNTTYNNSIILTKVSAQIATYQAGQARIDKHLDSIWPRLREIKERIQHLESLASDPRAAAAWAH